VNKKIGCDLDTITRNAPICNSGNGSNDVCDSSCNAESIALSLVAVAELLIIECKIEFTVVCQIIERKGSPSRSTTRAALINSLVKDSLRSNPRAKLWTHRGLNDPAADICHEDGVHLKDVGNKALYKSYRGAILFALSKL